MINEEHVRRKDGVGEEATAAAVEQSTEQSRLPSSSSSSVAYADERRRTEAVRTKVAALTKPTPIRVTNEFSREVFENAHATTYGSETNSDNHRGRETRGAVEEDVDGELLQALDQ